MDLINGIKCIQLALNLRFFDYAVLDLLEWELDNDTWYVYNVAR